MSDLAVRLRDGTHAETQAHQLIYQLIEKVADLALREVIPRAQHAHKGQRPGSELTLGHAGRQQPCMRLAAACTAAAVEAVFADLRAHRRNLEDLMALRLEGQLDLAATFTNRLGLAVHKAAYLGFGEHGPAVALVPRLRAALGITGAALHSIELAGPVRRWRLGGVVGIQTNALFEPLHAFDQQGNNGVALGHGLWKLRQPSIGWVHRHHSRRLDLHRESALAGLRSRPPRVFPSRSADCESGTLA